MAAMRIHGSFEGSLVRGELSGEDALQHLTSKVSKRTQIPVNTMAAMRIHGYFGDLFLVGQYPSSNAAVVGVQDLEPLRKPVDLEIHLAKVSKRTQIPVNDKADIKLHGFPRAVVGV